MAQPGQANFGEQALVVHPDELFGESPNFRRTHLPGAYQSFQSENHSITRPTPFNSIELNPYFLLNSYDIYRLFIFMNLFLCRFVVSRFYFIISHPFWLCVCLMWKREGPFERASIIGQKEINLKETIRQIETTRRRERKRSPAKRSSGPHSDHLATRMQFKCGQRQILSDNFLLSPQKKTRKIETLWTTHAANPLSRRNNVCWFDSRISLA